MKFAARNKTAIALVSALVLTHGRVAQAFADPAAAAALAQLVSLSTTSLEIMRQSKQYAQTSAKYAYEARQVLDTSKMLLSRPDTFYREALQNWSDQFPELERLRTNAEEIRRDVLSLQGSVSTSKRDRRSFADMMQKLRHDPANTFATLVHALDSEGVMDPHDRVIQQFGELHRAALENLTKLERASAGPGVNLLELQKYGARAAAISAKVQTQMAATVQSINGTLQQEYVRRHKAIGDAMDAHLHMIDEAAEASQTWILDPLGGRAAHTDSERAP